MLAEAVEGFLRVPHIAEALGVESLLAVHLDRSERAGIFLSQPMPCGIIENDGAVGAADFEGELRGSEHHKLRVVRANNERAFGPFLLHNEEIGALRWSAIERIDDVDNRVGADLQTKVAVIESEEHAVW